jgi:CBS domain-containing protein
VGDVMRTDFQTIDAGETLDVAFDRLHESDDGIIPVLSGDRLVGVVTIQNLMRYMSFRSALEKAGEIA